jgi:DNA-3-methyladenine glycosylase I
MSKTTESVIKHADGIQRCFWCGTDPVYVAYHDDEWGVPEYDSRALFEKLLLDGFQAGLSWITILRKRDAFREAFDGFEPEIMARYNARKLASLMKNEGIVRNKLKVEASVTNAQAYLALSEHQGFSTYLWNFIGDGPLQHRFRSRKDVPAATPLAEAISKDLKKRGFRFCGPTIVYAFMQACGLVNDHMVTCHRHGAHIDSKRPK